MKLSIRNKLIAVILLLSTIPMMVLGVMSYRKSEQALEDNFRNSVTELNGGLEKYVQEYLEKYEKSVLTLSKNSNLKLIMERPEYEGWMMDLFKDYKESFPEVEAVYLGTTDGTMRIYPNQDMGSGYDPRTRIWYKQAQEADEPIFTDMYKDAVTKKILVSCATPVRNQQGQFIGVVSADIPLDALSEGISSIKIGESGYPFIIAGNGDYITHKDKSKLGTKIEILQIEETLSATEDGLVDYEKEESDGSVSRKFVAYTKLEGVDWTLFSSILVNEIDKQTRPILWNTIMMTAIAIAMSSIIGIFFASKITNPIKNIVSDMNKVKDGDFTVHSDVKSNDELGELSDNFNMMIDNVKSLLEDAKQVSDEVSNAATNLAAVSEETSASAHEIAQVVDEIAKGASLQAEDSDNGVKIASSLDEKFMLLSKNSDTMSDNAKQIMDINVQGIKEIEELKLNTDKNNMSIGNIEQAIDKLNRRAEEIGGILQTIRAIADQTNLLALNASIEAARAGEAGRGFSVVADEIRKLAEGSGRATDEIRDIVEAIQNETRNTVEKMGEVKDVSKEQTRSVSGVNESFDKISGSINLITEEIEEINEFINSISKNKDEIVQSIENISAVSQQTAASAEEVTASVEQQSMAVEDVAISAQTLNELSIKLNGQIDRFKM